MQILCELCILLACLMQVGSMNAECPAWSVACFDGDGCVSTASLCDGRVQCRDRSDELLCTAKKADILHCHGDMFVCWDGEECIPRTQLCDGVHDCSDGSDEHICEPHERCRREGLFLCANNQQCLNTSRLCDGKSDCWDGSDEQGKCDEAKTECSSNKCQQICEVSPEGAKCRCLPGYLTLQNRTCIDIDECKAAEPPICSHICQNFPGSYNCSCHHGYKLTDNGKCSINGSLPIFLLAHGGEIHGYEMFQNRSISSNAAHMYVEEHNKIKAMALGPNKVLYFSDVVHKKIYSSHLDGDWKAQGQEVINVGLRNPEGMDVDWSTGHLYIADSEEGKILACQENWDICTAVITHLGHPKALSIDQRNRHLYWSDAGEPRMIGRADLDGRGRIKFVRDHVGHVTAMAVDFTTNRLYWADILFHKLESIGLNGMDRKIILYDDRLMGAVSIALFEDKIYWTNPSHGVYSANKFTGRDVQEELSEILSIASLIIMHPMLQNEEIKDNSCSSADCSDMCLPTNGPGHQCACPEDKHLESNNRTCQISFQVPRAYFGARKQIQQFPLLSVGYQDNLIGTVIEENIEKISSLDVSHKHGILVYSDIQRDVIARVNISDDMGFSNEKIVYSKDLHSVEKLQVDAVTGNIYWVDVGKKTVEVASLNGEYHRVLIPSTHFVQRLTSLAVAVMTGHVYLSLVGVYPTILSCTLDGTSCLPLSVEVYHPNDIVLYEGRLYIADRDHRVVQILSVEVPNGCCRKVHWQGYNRDLTRMAIYNDVLYWTEEDRGTSLFSVSLRNNQEETIVLHDIIPLSSIVIWNPKLTVVENACSRNNGGCSHLCLPVSQNSRVCACSDGFLLQKDNTSCIECKEPSCLCETYGNCSSIGTAECDGLVCDVSQCIPSEAICDEVLDCKDGADEEKSRCDQTTITDCGEGWFECDLGQCILELFVCDGQPDCSDASDEGHQCETACNNHHCDHRCVSMPYGSVCRCRPGYQVQTNGSCQDINECEADNGGCSQTCVNTEGGRLCQCSPHFISSNSSCIPPDPLPYLLFLEQGLITRYDSDNHGELVTVSASKSFVAFDVDMYTGDIFGISSEDPKLLLRGNQNRQKAEVLLRRSAKFAFVAYDWLGRNLYLSDIATPALIVCPLKHLKEGCLSLFHEETGSIVLHPLKGLMFWLYDDALQRSTMSGEKRGSVVDFESTMISSLSLDQFSGYLYWIDHYRGVIDSCDMNGHNRKTILKGGHQMRFLSVAVFGDHLYFTEENTHSLYKYNLPAGSRHALTSDLDFSLHLKVIHPILQNPGPRSDVCHRRSCSHLCLVTPEGAVCACPDGWDLISGKICKSPYVSTSATHINTTQSPPRASPSPGPPQKIPTPSTTTLTPLLSVINSTLGPRTETSTLPVSLCNLLCMNGGTCSYSEEKKMDYCICQAGYTGTYCNEEEPLEDLSRRSSHTHTSITVGVTLCCFLLLLLIVGVLGYMKYKRDKIVTVSEIVHFRPLLDKNNEEAEELVSDFPECISHRNRNQVYEEVSGIDSEDHGGLSWQYSTMSVDSAFISHIDENDDLTSQLISTNQKA